MDNLDGKMKAKASYNLCIGIVKVFIISIIIYILASCAQLQRGTIYTKIPFQNNQEFSNLPSNQNIIFPEFDREQILVIENISFFVYSSSTRQQLNYLRLITNLGGDDIRHYLDTPDNLTNVASTSSSFAMSRALRLYTRKPLIAAFELRDAIPLTGNVSISGYLIPAGSRDLGP